MLRRILQSLDAWADRRAADGLLLWKLFFGALLVRVLFTLWHPQINLVADMLGYHESGMSLLLNGDLTVKGRLSASRPPLYPILIYLVYYLFGAGNLLAVRLVQAALGAATSVLTFKLGEKVFNRKVAFWGALLVALYPAHWGFSDMIMSETFFTFLLLAGSYFLVDVPQGRLKEAFFAGILLGLATLTRTVMYQFPLFLAVVWLLFSKRRMAHLLPLAVLLLSFYFVLLPWKARNQRVFDKPVLTTKSGVDFFLYNHNPLPYIITNQSLEDEATLKGVQPWTLTELQRDEFARDIAQEWIKAHPLLFLFKGLRMQWNFFGVEREYIWWIFAGMWGRAPRWQVALVFLLFAPTVYLLVPLFLWGLVYGWKQFPLAKNVLWLLFYNLAVTFVYSGFSRNRMPLNPILLLFAGYALTQWTPILADWKLPGILRRPKVVVALSCLAFIGIGWLLEIGLDVGSLFHLGFTDPTWKQIN